MGTKVSGKGGDFTPHVAGVFPAICVDVIDMGAKATKFGLKDHVRLAFVTDQTINIGGNEELAIIMVTMTKTIGKDSNLRKFLEGWRGKQFTKEELEDGFDVDDLLGVPAMLNIVHRPSTTDPTKIYANIASASRVPKGLPLPDPDGTNYKRVRDRTKQEQAEYFARFRGEVDGGGIKQNNAPAARRPAAAPARQAPPPANDDFEDFEDFPAALNDEDDDLPF